MSVFFMPLKVIFAAWEEDHLEWLKQECAWREGRLLEVNELIKQREKHLNWLSQECAWRKGRLQEVSEIVRQKREQIPSDFAEMEIHLANLQKEMFARENGLKKIIKESNLKKREIESTKSRYLLLKEEITQKKELLKKINRDLFGRTQFSMQLKNKKEEILRYQEQLAKQIEAAETEEKFRICALEKKSKIYSEIVSKSKKLEESVILSKKELQVTTENKDKKIQALRQELREIEIRKQKELEHLQKTLENLEQKFKAEKQEIQTLKAGLDAIENRKTYEAPVETYTEEEKNQRRTIFGQFEILFGEENSQEDSEKENTD
ncbi:MAG: hypothetical protein LBF33_01680 [Oscillospiraceae bacterium]|nr:hypothetical protein [Oscillospiraceae bacterium]